MGIPSRGYRMGISDRGYRMCIPGSIPVGDAHTVSYMKLSYAGPSQHELPSRVQFLLISKAFIALNVFIPKFNYFILFCVFMVSLKILTLLSVSLIATDRPQLESYLFYHPNLRFLNVSAEGELIKG